MIMAGKEKRKSGVIFDLDGTVINSAEDIVDSLRHAYLENEIELEGTLDSLCIGPPLKDMIRNLTPGLTEEDISRVIQSFRRIYDTSPYANTKLYDGILEVIRQLKRQNIPLFIATNKPKHAAISLIKKFELNYYFLEVATPDSAEGVVFSKSIMLQFLKSRWNLHETYYIGDSCEDIRAAHENNLLSIAVLYGYEKKDRLYEERPHYIVEKAIDILSIILNNTKSEGTL
jgi:phosphoglycolate phosphatase